MEGDPYHTLIRRIVAEFGHEMTAEVARLHCNVMRERTHLHQIAGGLEFLQCDELVQETAQK